VVTDAGSAFRKPVPRPAQVPGPPGKPRPSGQWLELLLWAIPWTLVILQTFIAPMVGDEGADAGASEVIFDGAEPVLSQGGVPAPQTASQVFFLLALVGFATTLLAVVRSARRSRRRAAAGLVAIGLAVVLFVLVPTFSDIAKRGARPAKAHADVRTLASALNTYRVRTGALPESLGDLTSATTNPAGQVGGPLLVRIPSAPAGWTPYRYERRPDGTFRIESRRAGPPPGR
jgi:hypothetical protein